MDELPVQPLVRKTRQRITGRRMKRMGFITGGISEQQTPSINDMERVGFLQAHPLRGSVLDFISL
jgi:hypothetical protein